MQGGHGSHATEAFQDRPRTSCTTSQGEPRAPAKPRRSVGLGSVASAAGSLRPTPADTAPQEQRHRRRICPRGLALQPHGRLGGRGSSLLKVQPLTTWKAVAGMSRVAWGGAWKQSGKGVFALLGRLTRGYKEEQSLAA